MDVNWDVFALAFALLELVVALCLFAMVHTKTLIMKYYSDGYDTWAAMSLEEVAEEMHTIGMVEDYDFQQDDWNRVSANEKMFMCDLGEVIGKHSKLYRAWFRIKYCRPLWWVFLFHKKELSTKTGKAWFMCSTEY